MNARMEAESESGEKNSAMPGIGIAALVLTLAPRISESMSLFRYTSQETLPAGRRRWRGRRRANAPLDAVDGGDDFRTPPQLLAAMLKLRCHAFQLPEKVLQKLIL